VGLGRFLRLAGRLGVARLWTAHNVRPHETNSPLDHLGYFVVARTADLIITHGETARGELIRTYRPRCPVVTMPQGNYRQAYPSARDPRVVREELGCRSDVPLVSCVGAVRPYKGFELAIEAVAKLQGRVQLVIAGGMKDEAYLRHLRQKAQDGPVQITARPLTDQEFADLITASDAVLLPYRRITTSAVLLAAWTFGRGVVATPLPYFEEFVRPRPEAGQISENGSAEAFASAIQRYLLIDPAVRAAAASRASAEFTWERAASVVATPLRAVIEARRTRSV